jgi:hypothetical protein
LQPQPPPCARIVNRTVGTFMDAHLMMGCSDHCAELQSTFTMVPMVDKKRQCDMARAPARIMAPTGRKF